MPESPVSHQPIPRLFRYCLVITALFNLFGSISFAPPVYYQMADILGLPKDTIPFGLWVISSWILIFGIGYAWLAIHPKPEHLFVAVAAACKVAIAIFFFIFWSTGELPLVALLTGCGDLLFAVVFIVWLFQTRQKV